jgi:methylmalonyl-CoA mutase C-terminal domain/subunit
MPKRIRVLVTNIGLDGHDRGAKIVARAYRDAGMEVVYTGIHQTPDQVANAAVQEDVQVVAISIHSGAHKTVIPKVIDLIKSKGASDILFLVGGVIPRGDIQFLKDKGVDEVFGPGSSLSTIVDYTRNNVKG